MDQNLAVMSRQNQFYYWPQIAFTMYHKTFYWLQITPNISLTLSDASDASAFVGPLPVWPYWAIFESSTQQIFLQK